MKNFIFIITFLLIFPFNSTASELEDADNAYMQKKYELAIPLYESALEKGVSADIYYNLGNCYFRLNDIGKAILNYERSLKLAPNNEDIRINLEIAKNKCIDKFNSPDEMFFVTWIKELISSENANTWGFYGLVCFVLSLLFVGIYLYTGRLYIQKFSFTLFCIALFFSLTLNVFAAISHHNYYNDKRVVILKKEQLYKSSSVESEVIRDLNAGVVVELTENEIDKWIEIILPNGKKGWIKSENAERILNQEQ